MIDRFNQESLVFFWYTVEKQCYPKCSDNEKCQNDRCICKIGYYRDSSEKCVKYDRSWQLHDQCNQTYWYTENEAIECSFDCQRVQCSSGYHNNGSNCGKDSIIIVFNEKLFDHF